MALTVGLLHGAVWISGCCVHSPQWQRTLGSGVRTLHTNSSSFTWVHCKPFGCTKLHVPKPEKLPLLDCDGQLVRRGKKPDSFLAGRACFCLCFPPLVYDYCDEGTLPLESSA